MLRGKFMNYQNIIIVPEGLFFKEKTSQKNSLNKLAKAKKQILNINLFSSLYDRYVDIDRKQEIQLMLTALFPEDKLFSIQADYFTYLTSQHRLLKNVDNTLNDLKDKVNIFIASIYPQAVISKRLEQAKINYPLVANPTDDFTSMSKIITQIISQHNLDKNETLLIGTSLGDEIQAANDLELPSLWVNTNRKVPITPHPNLHVKKFEDIAFYFMG